MSLHALISIPPVVVAGLILLATIYCLTTATRTPAMFAASFSLVLLVWMFVNKQTFVNYYFLIAHALWLAVAAGNARVAGPEADL